MTAPNTYPMLFELLRQRNLSDLAMTRAQLGLDDAVQPETARDLLLRASRSWTLPGRSEP